VGGETEIWADGLLVDEDAVVAEAKFVTGSGRRMYEGHSSPNAQFLLRPFDREIERYGQILRDPDNPVRRLRLVTARRSRPSFSAGAREGSSDRTSEPARPGEGGFGA